MPGAEEKRARMDMSHFARLSSPALDAAVQMTRANALLSRSIGRVLMRWGVSWPQALSLLVLAEQQQPISATRLVEKLGLGRTAMTSVVDRLERQGWVERRASPVDRRVADLVLTEAGLEVVSQILPEVERASAAYFSDFDAREVEAWRNGSERLARVVGSTTLGGDGHGDGAQSEPVRG